MINLFGADGLSQLRFRFGRSYLVAARWRKIEFRDTVRHIPHSVKELGELVGLPKLERDTSEAYCIRDATITYRTAKLLGELYGEFGIAPKSTLAAGAYAIWRDSFWTGDPPRLPDSNIYQAAEAAYIGGRTEAFGAGEFGPVKAIDAASMFPWSMRSAPFPVPWGPWTRSTDLEPNGLFLADVDSRLPVPLLGVRTADGLRYPNGRFSGWFVGGELIAARGAGCRVRVRRGFSFLESCDPFRSYVDRFYRLKQAARGPKRLFYKLLLNSLYGKFGQKGRIVNVLDVESFLSRPDRPLDFRVWAGLVIFETDRTPPPWGNMVWAAIVTSRARVRLWREINRIRNSGGVPLYCDTDSVIYSGGPEYPVKARRIGDFENRGNYHGALITGRKEYGLLKPNGEWEVHAKGVPAAYRLDYLRTGRAEFRRPNRLKESARRGLTANSWETRIKVRRTELIEPGASGRLLTVPETDSGIGSDPDQEKRQCRIRKPARGQRKPPAKSGGNGKKNRRGAIPGGNGRKPKN